MAGSTRYTALLDTNVMVSSTLVDILIRFHMKKLYRAKWSRKIIVELEKTLLEIRPAVDVSNRIKLMYSAVLDAEVTGFEKIETCLDLEPDHNDKHILAAAIIGHCDAIVTFNTKDFKQEYLDPFSIVACHPDDFLMDQISLDTPKAMTAIKEMLVAWKGDDKTDRLIRNLETLGMTQTANTFDQYRELLK